MKNFDQLTTQEKHQEIANAHIDTLSECQFKEILEREDVKFQAEVILNKFRVDFIINGLVIEVDGKYHCEGAQRKKDKKRDTYILKHFGFDTKRITNEQVQKCYDGKISIHELLKPDERSIKEKYEN